MLSKSDASFIQHVITHIDEDLELFFTGEAVRNSSSLHNLENLCLGHCRKCGGSNADFVESPAEVSVVRINAPLFTTALIGNALEHFDVHVLNLFQNGLAQFEEFGVVHGDLPVDVLIIGQNVGVGVGSVPLPQLSHQQAPIMGLWETSTILKSVTS